MGSGLKRGLMAWLQEEACGQKAGAAVHSSDGREKPFYSGCEGEVKKGDDDRSTEIPKSSELSEELDENDCESVAESEELSDDNEEESRKRLVRLMKSIDESWNRIEKKDRKTAKRDERRKEGKDSRRKEKERERK